MKRDGSWWARVKFTDPETGKKREFRRNRFDDGRPVRTRSDALDLRDELLKTITDREVTKTNRSRATFADLAKWYIENHAVPPVYKEKRKVSGMRSFQTTRGHVEVLARPEFLGGHAVRQIRHAHLVQLRLRLLNDKSRFGTERSIANVNRIMSTLRRMLNVARKDGWITRSPFDAGESLISLADETPREITLSEKEEQRLYDVCLGVGKKNHEWYEAKRGHLVPILVAAFDTGMRLNELLTLTWPQIDFKEGLIQIDAFHTKTMRPRVVGMTDRLRKTLLKLREAAIADPDGRVFGIRSNVQNAWRSVRKEAELEHVRFHDIRHTAATRMIQRGMKLEEVLRLLGHTTLTMSYRYVNVNAEVATRAAKVLSGG